MNGLRNIVILVISLSILAIQTPLYAKWWIYKSTGVGSKERHSLRIEKIGDGTVRAMFSFANEKPGVFAAKLPVYKVDDHKVQDLELKTKGQMTDPEKSRWIKWRISAANEPVSDDLVEIMNGGEITFQFYMPDGTIEETTFSLRDAKQAIEEILR